MAILAMRLRAILAMRLRAILAMAARESMGETPMPRNPAVYRSATPSGAMVAGQVVGSR